MTVPRSPIRLTLWAVVALSALFALLLMTVTLALPGWASGRGAALASQALGRPVSIARVQVQPWRLAVVVEGLAIAGSDAAAPPQLTLARLDAALSLRSLLRGHVVLESLQLVQPELRVARLAEGRYDVDDLIRRLTAQPAGADQPAMPFAVYNIELREGRVLFDDSPVQRRHVLDGLRLALPFVSTIATDVTVTVQPHLSGRLDGVAFDSRAEALPFAEEASARLSLRLAGLDLAPLAAYLPAALPLRLRAGHLDADLALDFAERRRQPPVVKLSGALRLLDLLLTRPDGAPLLTLKSLELPLTDVQPLRRQLALGLVRLDTLDWRAAPLPPARGGAAVSPAWQLRIAGLELRDGQVSAAGVLLQDVQLKLGAAAWPLQQPVQLDANLRLDAATLAAQVRLAPERLQVEARLTSLALAPLAPWLPLPATARLTGVLSGQTALSVDQPLAEGAADRARLVLRELQLDDARLSLSGQPLLSLAQVRLEQAEIDVAKRQLRMGQLQLDAPRAQLARDAAGRLNLAALLPQPEATTKGRGPGWTLQLAGLAVERGGLHWHDAAVAAGLTPVALALEPLRLQAGPLAWPAATPVATQLSGRLAALGPNDRPLLASGGDLQWQGRVGLVPWTASGELQTSGLPLHLLGAYLDPAWGLHLQRAELGLKTTLSAAQQPDGAWLASVAGDLRLGPLSLMQTRLVDGQRVIGEDLLSWQALQLEGLRLALAPGAPPRLSVREAQLDDAYARLIVDEQGRFNLRDIRPAEATSAPAPAAPPPEIAVDKLRLNRGLVDFSDRFVRPNYSTRLSELQGSLGAFSSSSAQMAPLTLRGKIAGTGLLEINGQLKPGTPLAMDVQADASDIELAPLSAYAGKYAGYAIERGKLSARLHYQIEPGGRLSASNQIILNQLTLGERVESADATALPIRLAVALLRDRDGVIDVNLPVSGSLNDPEFSVGGLVWKLVLKLVGKALTSPFALFSGSDEPDAALIAFAPGSAELAGTDKLDRIAQLLADKPGVQLTLTGWVDPVAETVALRELQLQAALQVELKTAPTPEAALLRLYQASKLPNKPRNLLGLAKDLPPEQMRGLLMGSYPVDDETLRQLALARAVAVRDALLARGAPNARVFVAAPKLCDGACESGWQPHVEMSLHTP